MQSNKLIHLLLAFFLLCLVSSQDTSSVVITVGPVIGRVNTTTARILFEFNSNITIQVNVTDPAGTSTGVVKTVEANRATPFAFNNLTANTTYRVSINDTSINMTESYFTTLSGESGVFNFATLSCMDQHVNREKEPQADLWADILKRIQNKEIQYLLHTGDQVYMDDPFGKNSTQKPYYNAIATLNSTGPENWNASRETILESLRNEYRQTWSTPSIREVLAKIPSITILDDHQIRDDWGYLPEDSDPNSKDFFYGTLARQVYYEYERQLREDIDFNNITSYTADYYYEIFNDIGFFFIDYRGIRSWNRNFSDMGTSQIGRNQSELLKQVLNTTADGTFTNLTNFYLVTPLTYVFLIEALVKIGYFNNNDAAESWSYAYRDEQIDLLNYMRDWKNAKPGRVVTILDGDVHMAGFTDIYYEGSDDEHRVFKQFTTSSIASSAPGDATMWAFEAIKEVETLSGPWTYEHHDWTNEFNYGVCSNQRGENSEPSVNCYLVQAPRDAEPRIVKDDGNDINIDEWTDTVKGWFT